MAARVQQTDRGDGAEKALHVCRDVRVGVQDEVDLNGRARKFRKGLGNGREALLPALAAMAGDQQATHRAVAERAWRKPRDRLKQSVDAAVAGDVNLARDCLGAEVGSGQFRRREQQVGVGIDCGSIFFLGPRQRWIVGTKASLDVRDGDAGDEAGKRTAERARRVTLDDQQVRRGAQQRLQRPGYVADMGMGVLSAGTAKCQRREVA